MNDALGNTYEQACAQLCIGAGPPTRPTARFIQLHSGDPGDDGSANVIAGITRADCTANLSRTSHTVGAGSQIDLGSYVGANVTATHYSIWDAASGGNMICRGALNASKAIEDGNAVTVEAGDLSIAFAGTMLCHGYQDKLLDWLFISSASPTFVSAANLRQALWSNDPGQDGSGTELTAAGTKTPTCTASGGVISWSADLLWGPLTGSPAPAYSTLEDVGGDIILRVQHGSAPTIAEGGFFRFLATGSSATLT